MRFSTSPWYTLAVLTVINAINWADRSVVPILFPAIGSELGLTDTQLGIIGGFAFSGVYAVAAFVFGRAADRNLRTRIIAFGLVVWSAATAASGLAEGFGSLFAARFFTGVGEASLYPCALSLLAERFSADTKGRAMGIFAAASAAGGGLGVAIGGSLATAVGWRTVFFLYGAVGLLLLPLLFTLGEQPRPTVRQEESAGGRRQAATGRSSPTDVVAEWRGHDRIDARVHGLGSQLFRT